MTTSLHKIVVVGGGAAGLELATSLGNKLGKRGHAEVTLIDANRTHIWKPLLHQVASGSTDPGEVALEYMAQARWHGFRFRLGSVSAIDRVERKILLGAEVDEEGEEVIAERSFSYDTLVIAVGSLGNDFGIEGVMQHCLMLDNKDQAVKFQRILLNKLIRAHSQHGPIEEGELDVAIVGAGATGVELAAQLHQASRQLAQYGLDEIKPDKHMRIHVIDASPRILPALPEKLSLAVTAELESLGVTVMTSAQVNKVTQDGIYTGDDKFIPASIKVWAAGIKAPAFLSEIGLETNRINQIRVKPNLLSTMDDRIFVIGDCADCPMGDSSVPPRAQAAHQQASFVSKQIRKRLKGKSTEGDKYVYRDYGALVTLGKYSTVGSLMGSITGSVRVSGWIAKTVYLSLYKMHQIALHGYFRTILMTLAQWLRRTVDPSIKLH
jgi:NADH:ubiquinone reductase (H+-translocating)